MKTTCDCCDHDSSTVRASLRRTMAECEDCGRMLCEDCLKDMAVEKGMLSAEDAAAILERDGASGFLNRCDASQMFLCPECYEDGGVPTDAGCG